MSPPATRTHGRIRRSPRLRRLLSAFQLLSISAFQLFTLSALSQPAWWTDYGLLDPQAEADDFAAANLGQAKNAAAKARLYLDDTLPGGAGSDITTMVDAWTTPTTLTDDFAALNIGQLKALTAPFYDRLIAVGFTTTYPWTSATTDDDDFALANIGQLKLLFGFEIGIDPQRDADADGLQDAWEFYYFGSLARDGTGDFDQDGLADRFECQMATNPTVDESVSPGARDTFSYDDRGWLDSCQLTASPMRAYSADPEGNLTAHQ